MLEINIYKTPVLCRDYLGMFLLNQNFKHNLTLTLDTYKFKCYLIYALNDSWSVINGISSGFAKEW